jgi:glycine cleavage system P protein (glycine dehydrogenase) subunit 1
VSLARAHPYIPNSAPRIRQEMLEAIGVDDTDDLYAAIPERLRLGRLLEIEPAVGSEAELRRRIEGMLDQNVSARDRISFLGGGCWPHYVPAVVDEIIGRSEFLTAYYGETYSDHGKLQALFEFASLVGDLVECDVVSQPTYDWGSAAASAILMAGCLTGRTRVLVPALLSPERRSIIAGTCGARMTVQDVPCDAASGALDLAALEAALDEDAACVYFENPAFLGTLEPDSAAIAERAHARGALAVVGVDATSLGVLEAPPRYGADLVCGELQGLGIHMHYGGGTIGFIASADDERIVAEYPTFLVGAGRTVDDEWGFGEVRWDRMAYVQRGEAHDFTGTTQCLWAIGVAVHLALLGPDGMRELGTTIMQRSQYAATRLGELPGIRSPALAAPFFKEFVIDLAGTGRTVAEVNRALAAAGIHGPLDLSRTFGALGQSALVCVTEVHTQADIDWLVDALATAIA